MSQSDKNITSMIVAIVSLGNGSMLSSGARPIDGISIEFKILSKFGVLWLKICSTNNNEILHTSLQLHCRNISL